ncbi:hypothetical protein FRB99_001094, partial [Tulasnella sp. 403]
MQLYPSLVLIALLCGNVLANFFPRLYFIGRGQLSLASNITIQIQGPDGLRTSDEFASGTLIGRDGRTLATLRSGIENGLEDSNGFFRRDSRTTWRLADNTTAYATIQGIGPADQGESFRFDVETNSTRFGYLNKIFILGNAKTVNRSLMFSLWST